MQHLATVIADLVRAPTGIEVGAPDRSPREPRDHADPAGQDGTVEVGDR